MYFFKKSILETVYIFGAGASYGTHPTILDFYESLDEALNSPDQMPFREFEDLIARMRVFPTPDSYAKRLYNNKVPSAPKDEYSQVKSLYDVWINYFTWSDFYPGHWMEAPNLNRKHVAVKKGLRLNDPIGKVVDSRYLNLLKALGKKGLKNCRFFTWNYDQSLTLCLEDLELEKYAKNITHLNGHASRDLREPHSIKFYWEHEGLTQPPPAKKYIFVGYSFPLDNRDQDQCFLNFAESISAKIIIQNPILPDLSFTSVNYHHVKQVAEFIT